MVQLIILVSDEVVVEASDSLDRLSPKHSQIDCFDRPLLTVRSISSISRSECRRHCRGNCSLPNGMAYGHLHSADDICPGALQGFNGIRHIVGRQLCVGVTANDHLPGRLGDGEVEGGRRLLRGIANDCRSAPNRIGRVVIAGCNHHVDDVGIGLRGDRLQSVRQCVGGIESRDDYRHGGLVRGHGAISCPAVPFDLQSIADPRLILLGWAAGLALVGGSVALQRIVGPGFNWLVGGVAAMIGLPGSLADGAWWARLGLVAVGVGLLWARNRPFAGVMFLVGGLGYLIEAAVFGGWVSAMTATLALGGVTGEMALGHWYLVDPRLPRSALRNLAVVGIAGLIAEALFLISMDISREGAGVAFWVLLVTSVILMGAVIGALRYPAYSGVMAATGLSYLALLTTLGAVFVGRASVAGLGPFAS